MQLASEHKASQHLQHTHSSSQIFLLLEWWIDNLLFMCALLWGWFQTDVITVQLTQSDVFINLNIFLLIFDYPASVSCLSPLSAHRNTAQSWGEARCVFVGVCVRAHTWILQLYLMFFYFYQITGKHFPPPGAYSPEKKVEMFPEGEILNSVLV